MSCGLLSYKNTGALWGYSAAFLSLQTKNLHIEESREIKHGTSSLVYYIPGESDPEHTETATAVLRGQHAYVNSISCA